MTINHLRLFLFFKYSVHHIHSYRKQIPTLAMEQQAKSEKMHSQRPWEHYRLCLQQKC